MKNNKFSKITIALAILVTAAIITPVLAHELGTQGLEHRIKKIGVLGRGIAVSATDPSNFEYIRIGVARVTVNLGNQTTDVSAGLLQMGNTTYKLRNITIGNGTVSGNIFSNDTQVGSFSVTAKFKGEHEVWFGTMSLNGENWNVYILQGERLFKASEKAEKIEEFCEEHPDRCTNLARGIGPRFCEKVEDESCREKIHEFCEQNPNDSRCVAIAQYSCREHLDDSRCQMELKDYCEDHPTDERCIAFCQKFPDVCEGEEETTTTTSSTTTTTVNNTNSTG